MAKKDKDKISVNFIGNNACDVAGSMIHIEFNDKQILLDCGMTQTSNFINDYKENAKPFKGFKPKKIDYVFIGDVHADHQMLLSKLCRSGFQGEIFMTPVARQFIEPMQISGANIVLKESTMMKRDPYFTESDVYEMLDRIVSYDYGKTVWLDEKIGFTFLRNSHTIASAQIELYFKKENEIKTILYTSDMGNPISENHYVDKLEMCKSASLVISECTYGGQLNKGRNRRDKDLEKMKTVINKTCLEDKGKVLIPVFAYGRSMEILTCLYEVYGQDENFKIPIVCDSPLLYDMMRVQGRVLTGKNKELFDKVIAWSNVKFIRKHADSTALISDTSPKVVLSSSGMLDKGRSVSHLQNMIGKAVNHILFCGYCGQNTLGHKILSGQKNISIDGKSHRCNCNITNLTSFSSHISHYSLIDYLSNIKCEKIALVHGQMDNKIEFKRHLDYTLSKKDSTTRVLAVNKGTTITL